MTGEGSSPDDRDYDAMEAALSETVRGRWFLSEHARRHRGHETQILLDAIGRIEATMAVRNSIATPTGPEPDQPEPREPELARSGADLSDIALTVTRIRDALMGAREGAPAPESLSRLSEAATSDVLDATERIQEAAWTLRERGADPAICDLLDQRATEIYAACAVQDGLARKVAAGVELVRSLDERLGGTGASAERGGPAPPVVPLAPVAAPTKAAASNGPRVARAIVAPARALDPSVEATAWPLTDPTREDDADDVRDGEEHPGGRASARAPFGAGRHPATLDAIDALDVSEKLRLFT